VASALDTIDQLRTRISRLQESTPAGSLGTLETHPALAGLVQLRAGAAYSVDSATLALALLAGPSRAGGWCAAVGVADFGVEAAAALGVDLGRTVLVPDPGDQWLEVTAALVDVATVVLVRTAGRVTPAAAEKLAARLRKRGAALVAQERTPGDWPRCEVRLTTRDPVWGGLGQGHGHLSSRRILVEAQRGTAPPRRGALWFPAEDQTYRRDETRAAPVAAPVEGVA
jgi:hypothetical protein